MRDEHSADACTARFCGKLGIMASPESSICWTWSAGIGRLLWRRRTEVRVPMMHTVWSGTVTCRQATAAVDDRVGKAAEAHEKRTKTRAVPALSR